MTFDFPSAVRQVRRAGGTRSALLRRTFPASVEQLWRSCTDPDPLSRWIGRLEGGGEKRQLIMGANGEHVVELTVLRCEPPHRLELLWAFPGEDDSIVRATVTPAADGAELTIEHLGLTDPHGILYGAGWEEFLIDLGDQLTGRARSHDCNEVEAAARTVWTALAEEPDDRWGRLDDDAYTLTRTVALDPEALWAAVTTSDGLAPWFGRMTRDGADWAVEFDEGRVHGRIEKCIDGRSFTTTFVQDFDLDRTHRVAVEVGDGSLTLRHQYAASSTDRLKQGLAAGWWAYLRAVDGDGDWAADFETARLVLR